MKKGFIIIVLTLWSGWILAQNFEQRVKDLSQEIEKITTDEKAKLKEEIDNINYRLENKAITAEEAEKLKLDVATQHAQIIEQKVAEKETELKKIIQDKVDGNIYTPLDTIAQAKKDSIEQSKNHHLEFGISMGFNNLVKDFSIGDMGDSDYKFLGSRFWQFDLGLRSRLFKSRIFYAKYGLALTYENLNISNNKYFKTDGDQTYLETYPKDVDWIKFRRVTLTVPFDLEMNLSRSKNPYKGFKIGIGGYAGFNVKSKQIIRYEEDDRRFRLRETGDFNVNPFVYGLGAYVDYNGLRLFCKYDLNPVFKDNPVDLHTISIGLRLNIGSSSGF